MHIITLYSGNLVIRFNVRSNKTRMAVHFELSRLDTARARRRIQSSGLVHRLV